jgi:hypothetical protein
MKTSLLIVLTCVIFILIMAAGCTQTAQPMPNPTPMPTPRTTGTVTIIPTSVPTTLIPVQTMTAPPLPLPTSIKDSALLFTISAPVGYNGSTIRAPTSDYSILYKTTVYNPAISKTNGTIYDNSGNYIELADSLTIFSYSTSTSVDQNIRNILRSSGAVFNESAITSNGITYTRFDAESNPYSGAPGKTVVFIGNKASANERGYLPVLIYTMTSDGTFSQATYENMAKSFRYYTGRNIGSAAGEETDRPPFYQ